jgi:type I restriction enzyme R subunit
LFTEHGVSDIEGFARQTITDPKHTYDILEQAVELLEDIKLRASFEVYLTKFLQSMDIILPHSAANPFKIPAKRFGFLLVKVKERYKDDTLNISGAGEKVRKLINEHLVSLGIDPKIKPVELFSPRFIQELDKHQSPKARASEMEHAIRKHCKVHFTEDPVLYQKLSDKLEALIQQYKDNWDLLCQHLAGLRSEAQAGRKQEVGGVSAKAAPFYDVIGQISYGGDVPPADAAVAKQLVDAVLAKLRATIGMVNFWNKPADVADLRGELSDLLLFSNIDAVVDKSDRIVTEVVALAKVRQKDILG